MRHAAVRASALGIALAAALVAGVRAAPASPQDAAAATLSDSDRKHFEAADLVFVGEVLEVGAPPSHATGYAVTARQPVRFAVERVLRGRLSLGEVAVHFIVAGGKTQDPALEKHRLNSSLFPTGKKLIVAARWIDAMKSRLGEGDERPFRYLLADDDDQVLPLEATPSAVRAVVQAFESK
jgi:hypothetical protein